MTFDSSDDDDITNPAPELAHISNLGVDISNRTIYIGDIEEDTGTYFMQVRNFLADKGDGPIHCWINTAGGDCVAMYAMHDAIQTSPIDVVTYGTGMVCSAGVLLLACGHERYVTESCILMSHESSGFGGYDLKLSEARDRRAADDFMETHWCQLMSRHTGESPEFWQSITKQNAEFWLLGGRAIVEAGIADGVLG